MVNYPLPRGAKLAGYLAATAMNPQAKAVADPAKRKAGRRLAIFLAQQEMSGKRIPTHAGEDRTPGVAAQSRHLHVPPHSTQYQKRNRQREIIECSEKQAFNFQHLADPSDVEQIVQAALNRTTPDQVRRGTAGNNVDRNRQFVLTEDGFVDLKHVVSAGNNRFSNIGLGATAGLKVEFDQLLRRSPSAFAREDLLSNQIGQNARLRANIFPDLTFARAVQKNIDRLGAVKLKDAPVCAK